MNKNRVKKSVMGIILITIFGVSNFSYAETDSDNIESEIKKIQYEIKLLQETQTKMAKKLSELNQDQLLLADNYDVNVKRVGSRGRR